MISNLDNYKNKIDVIIRTLGVEHIRFYSGESILNIRDTFEENVNRIIDKALNDLNTDEYYNLFIYTIQKGLTLPVPYTTSNLKLMHYAANSIRNLTCIFYKNATDKVLTFTTSKKQKMFDGLHNYIRQADAEEAMFVYRNSILNIDDKSLILSELNMNANEEYKDYSSDFISIKAYRDNISFEVFKIPIKEV